MFYCSVYRSGSCSCNNTKVKQIIVVSYVLSALCCKHKMAVQHTVNKLCVQLHVWEGVYSVFCCRARCIVRMVRYDVDKSCLEQTVNVHLVIADI